MRNAKSVGSATGGTTTANTRGGITGDAGGTM